MRFLCEAIHAKYVASFADSSNSICDLSPRERDVIRWTADGKSAYEAGCILSISERTVNFHLSNVMRKVDAVNKTQAAVKVFSLGLV